MSSLSLFPAVAARAASAPQVVQPVAARAASALALVLAHLNGHHHVSPSGHDVPVWAQAQCDATQRQNPQQRHWPVGITSVPITDPELVHALGDPDVCNSLARLVGESGLFPAFLVVGMRFPDRQGGLGIRLHFCQEVMDDPVMKEAIIVQQETCRRAYRTAHSDAVAQGATPDVAHLAGRTASAAIPSAYVPAAVPRAVGGRWGAPLNVQMPQPPAGAVGGRWGAPPSVQMPPPPAGAVGGRWGAR